MCVRLHSTPSPLSPLSLFLSPIRPLSSDCNNGKIVSVCVFDDGYDYNIMIMIIIIFIIILLLFIYLKKKNEVAAHDTLANINKQTF